MENKTWHTDRWPPLAWLETVIKLAGMAYGFSAMSGAFRAERFAVPEGPAFFQWIVLILLSLGLLAAIGQRYQMREVVSMVFVILNNIAHWGLVAGMAAGETGGVLPFAGLFLAGDLVKVIFIRVNRFRIGGYDAGVLYGLTGVYIVGYLLILLAGWFG